MDQKRLKELLDYCPDSGFFTWRVSHPRAKAGSCAGTKDHYGYLVIRVDQILYKAHRLAWLYVHGVWPAKNLDHINRIKDDNRLCNLRDVSQSVNMHNTSETKKSKSGVKGVVWKADKRKWKAQIRVAYKTIHLGYFDEKVNAIEARKNAAVRLLSSATF